MTIEQEKYIDDLRLQYITLSKRFLCDLDSGKKVNELRILSERIQSILKEIESLEK